MSSRTASSSLNTCGRHGAATRARRHRRTTPSTHGPAGSCGRAADRATWASPAPSRRPTRLCPAMAMASSAERQQVHDLERDLVGREVDGAGARRRDGGHGERAAQREGAHEQVEPDPASQRMAAGSGPRPTPWAAHRATDPHEVRAGRRATARAPCRSAEAPMPWSKPVDEHHLDRRG